MKDKKCLFSSKEPIFNGASFEDIGAPLTTNCGSLTITAVNPTVGIAGTGTDLYTLSYVNASPYTITLRKFNASTGVQDTSGTKTLTPTPPTSGWFAQMLGVELFNNKFYVLIGWGSRRGWHEVNVQVFNSSGTYESTNLRIATTNPREMDISIGSATPNDLIFLSRNNGFFDVYTLSGSASRSPLRTESVNNDARGIATTPTRIYISTWTSNQYLIWAYDRSYNRVSADDTNVATLTNSNLLDSLTYTNDTIYGMRDNTPSTIYRLPDPNVSYEAAWGMP